MAIKKRQIFAAASASLTVLLGVGLALNTQTLVVKSDSMSPTLKVGEHIAVLSAMPIVCKVLHHPPKRGDIIVFRGFAGNELVVKRLVALPGDHVCIKSGTLFVNGNAVHERYAHYQSVFLQELDQWPQGTGSNSCAFVVPANKMFVLGDNRSDSTDSRVWGSIPESVVVGRMLARIP